jgi:Cu(I)-responsive transcriptional regulator
MNIGAAAGSSGVTAKMIRHYEAIGLLRPVERRANDYRDYGERDIHELRFIRRARRLGFSIAEISALLALWRDRRRSSREVRRIAETHIDDLKSRIAEMQAMASTLRELIAACHGDDRPHCPILEDLALGSTTELGRRLRIADRWSMRPK